ncbi:MAG: hypothetical protein Q7T72_11485 [Bacteroidales bacterium]|nr:hypothetical protein [Bacteroidales bacterium]
MNEVECVRTKNVSPVLDEYLKKLIEEVKFEAKFLEWNGAEASNNLPLILLSSPENLLALKQLIENRDEKIIIALNSRRDFKLVSELKPYFAKIFGFIDVSQEIEYNIPILKNYLNLNFSKNSIKLDKLANDLNKILEFTQSQLTKIKGIHDRFVKVKMEKLKGVTLTSKFMAGEKSGGEFFETIQNDQELLFIQAGSDSYLLSSIILSEIETLKEKAPVQDLQNQIMEFQKVIEHYANENKADLTYCLMNLNLKTLQATFSLKGHGHIYYQNELISFDKPIKLNLKPRDKLCILSQGALKNWELLNLKPLTSDFFRNNYEIETKELINEFFFEVSRNKTGTFLIYDALMAVVEIEENILYQLS